LAQGCELLKTQRFNKPNSLRICSEANRASGDVSVRTPASGDVYYYD